MVYPEGQGESYLRTQLDLDWLTALRQEGQQEFWELELDSSTQVGQAPRGENNQSSGRTQNLIDIVIGHMSVAARSQLWGLSEKH